MRASDKLNGERREGGVGVSEGCMNSYTGDITPSTSVSVFSDVIDG